MLILQLSTVHKTYYEMTAMDKWALISESVAMTRIDSSSYWKITKGGLEHDKIKISNFKLKLC
jgi:hypothetical protein